MNEEVKEVKNERKGKNNMNEMDVHDPTINYYYLKGRDFFYLHLQIFYWKC